MKDKWAYLRKDLFGNVEPNVILLALTQPIGNFDPQEYHDLVEKIPADAASVSYGKTIATTDAAKKLNKKLIEMGHLTPLEAVQFNFKVTGISKACSSQMSRHRVGQGHVGLSRRYTEQRPEFVYPLFDYIEDEQTARKLYVLLSDSNEIQFAKCNALRAEGVKKQDARMIMPVSIATERNWFINARALRDFFRLRLDPAAEWEIRRLARQLLNIVMHITPSLFCDIEKKFAPDEKKA